MVLSIAITLGIEMRISKELAFRFKLLFEFVRSDTCSFSKNKI